MNPKYKHRLICPNVNLRWRAHSDCTLSNNNIDFVHDTIRNDTNSGWIFAFFFKSEADMIQAKLLIV